MLVNGFRFMPAIAVLAAGPLVMAAEPTTAELKAQIDALQGKIERLEAKQASAADVDATLARVLADADKRSQMMQSEGFTAGYNKGKFVLQSADGKYVFIPTAQMQGRYIGSSVDGDYEDGFELRRVKFGFTGNVVAPELTYKFQWATDRGNGNVALEDAWARYRFCTGFSIFGGQFEDLTNHEALVSSSRQLAVESSLVNRALSESVSDYVQGVGGAYETGIFRVQAAYHDGVNSDNTNYANQTYNGHTVNWGTSGRAEARILGKSWKPYDDFTARGNDDDLLVVGTGAHYSDLTDAKVILWSADVQWEPKAVSGLGLFASVLDQKFQENGAADANNWGFTLQAGYMLSKDWEVFGRFGQIDYGDNAVYGTVQEYTAGVNYYINGHAAKFTADLVYLPSGSPAESAAGIRQVTDDSDQVVARVQFQLLL